MASTLKQELEIYVRALAAFDEEDYDTAFEEFERIANTSSKIRFNMALVLASAGQHEEAIEQLLQALRMDRYLAVAYFQQGISTFLLGDFEGAREHFDDALLYLRGNDQIDYEQLGLNFSLYACEVLFNRGLCSVYLKEAAGLADLRLAAQRKKKTSHDIIDRAVRDKGIGHTLFSIPTGLLYRPNESKVRNIAARDYLGKARLIASSDVSDVGTGFRGYEKQQVSDNLAQTFSQYDLQSENLVTTLSGKRMTQARELEFSRLDEALLRKASTTGARERFPPPSRSRTISSRALPSSPGPSPTTQIRPKGRKLSDASSVSSIYSEQSVQAKSKLSRAVTPAFEKNNAPILPKLSRSVTSASRENTGTIIPKLLRSQTTVSKPQASRLKVDTQADAPTFSQQLAMLQRELPSTPPSVVTSSNISSKSSQSLTRSGSSQSSVVSSSSLRAPVDATPVTFSQDDDDQDLVDHYYTQTLELFAPRESSKLAQPVVVMAATAAATTTTPITSAMKVKVKVYGLDDIRSVTVDSTITLKLLQSRLADKFGWSQRMPKLRTKDEEGEMILLQDQEDLEECLESAVAEAIKAGKASAKLDIWVKQG